VVAGFCLRRRAYHKIELDRGGICRVLPQLTMGILASSYLSYKSERVAPETPTPQPHSSEPPNVEPERTEVLMPTCIDCKAPLKHPGDAYCGLTCYGKWYIREQYRMEGEEPPVTPLEDGPIRLSISEFALA
jgi:hypothetical protein